MENFEDENTVHSLLDDFFDKFVDLVSEELEVSRDLVTLHIADIEIDDDAEYPLVDDSFREIATKIGVTSDNLECAIRLNIDIALMDWDPEE